MRKNVRTRMLAACLATFAVVTMSACSSEPTHVFTPEEPSISQGVDEPESIDNAGRFQYKLNEEKYKEALGGATDTGRSTLTGHKVYADADGSLFIISGFDRVTLENEQIPQSAWVGLREESTGNKIFVQYSVNDEAEDLLVTQWVRAWQSGSAMVSAAKNGSYNGKVIVVNNRILDTRAGTVSPKFVDGVVYIPAVSLLAEAGNMTMVEAEGTVVFSIVSAQTGKTEKFVVDAENPRVASSEDGLKSLVCESDLVKVVDGVVYVDPVGMASVFDWQVDGYGKIFEGKNGVLNIVTDKTFAEGHAVAAYGCRVDVNDSVDPNAEDKGKIEEEQDRVEEDLEEKVKLEQGKQQELEDLRKDLEQDETKTPEDIDQAIKDKETEIDQQIEDGTYTPPTPNPELTDPAEPPPAAGNSSGEQGDGGDENPVDPPPANDPPVNDPPPRTDVPSGVDPEVWDLLQDMGITPGTGDGSGSIDGGSIFGN